METKYHLGEFYDYNTRETNFSYTQSMLELRSGFWLTLQNNINALYSNDNKLQYHDYKNQVKLIEDDKWFADRIAIEHKDFAKVWSDSSLTERRALLRMIHELATEYINLENNE